VKRFLYRIFCGVFLGLSIFAPGFSGSLVAIAMGIYHEFVGFISNPLKKIKQNIIFFAPIGIGMIISAILFIITFRQLFESYEKAIYLLFVGLIAGSIPLVFVEVKKIGFKPHYLIGAAIALILALAISIYASGDGLISEDTATMSDWQGLALGGLSAGITALIPGMSLSTVLILMGVYSPLIYAAEALLRSELSFILPIGLFLICLVVGLMSTAKIIKYVFKRYPGFANTIVLGFQFGSLLGIAYQSHYIAARNFTWLLGGIMLAVGCCISVMFMLIGKFMNKTETV